MRNAKPGNHLNSDSQASNSSVANHSTASMNDNSTNNNISCDISHTSNVNSSKDDNNVSSNSNGSDAINNCSDNSDNDTSCRDFKIHYDKALVRRMQPKETGPATASPAKTRID